MDFAVEAKKNPRQINFTNAGAAINSTYNEYFPSITADEKYFLYTRRLDCKECFEKQQEDLFISVADNSSGLWLPSKRIDELSSFGNEGAPCISADGNYMFITMSQEMDGMYMGGQAKGYGSCDIFFTQKINGKWSKPVNLGPKINSSQWESQPSFSSDGKTLYFIRGAPQRNGTIKNTDIYFAVSKWLQTQDLWGHLSFISGEYPRETMRPTSIRWFDSVRVHPNLEHAAADPHPPRPETTG